MLSNSKLPALDPARVLVILRVALGAQFVSTFFENLGKGLYGAEGYAGLIRGYIQNGHAPAVWKQVMEFTAAHAAVAGPLQALLEASLGRLAHPRAFHPACCPCGIRTSEWVVGLGVGNGLDMGAARSDGRSCGTRSRTVWSARGRRRRARTAMA